MNIDDPDWIDYECKSGEILFYYNKTTGEHRWPYTEDNKSAVICCKPVQLKDVHSIGIQTGDSGCSNGCTSMYVDKPQDRVDVTRTALETTCKTLETTLTDQDWFGYECKSGQIMFYFNRTTGEHRWISGGGGNGNVLNPTHKRSDHQSVLPSQLCSTGTETDLYGVCSNRCTSRYIKIIQDSVEYYSLNLENDTEMEKREVDVQKRASTSTNTSTSIHLTQNLYQRKEDQCSVDRGNGAKVIEAEKTSQDQNKTTHKKIFPCKLCKIVLGTAAECYNHLKTHCSQTSSECPVCKRVFRKRSYLHDHLNKHSQLMWKQSDDKLDQQQEHNSYTNKSETVV